MGSMLGGGGGAPPTVITPDQNTANLNSTFGAPNTGASTGGGSTGGGGGGGGILNGLFQGQPIPPQPTGSDTSTQYPLWLQQYTANLANAATNLSSTPYTPVPFGQVAAPSAATQQAWQMAVNNVGNYQPLLGQGANLTGLAAQMAQNNNGYQGPLNQALALSQQGAQEAAGNTGYQQPLNQAMGLTLGGAAQAAGNTGYQGILNQALAQSQAAAQPITGQQIANYMNPFEGQVIGGLQSAANTNLFQNVLPQVQDRFVSAGQSRSPQEMQATNNAVYQSQQALDQATSGALQGGYQGALSTALSEQGAAQQGASQLGNLASSEQQLGAANIAQELAAGNQLGGLASSQQQLGASNIAQQLAAGSQLGNLASSEQQLGASNINQIASLGGQSAQLGALTQQLGAADTGQVAAAGQAQDLTNQANVNAALNNFYAQQQWPYQNLAFASNIIRGQPVASNTTTVGTTFNNPGYTASPLASFIGTTLGASGINSQNQSRPTVGSNGLIGSSTTPTSTGQTAGLMARGGRVRPRGALSAYKRKAA